MIAATWREKVYFTLLACSSNIIETRFIILLVMTFLHNNHLLGMYRNYNNFAVYNFSESFNIASKRIDSTSINNWCLSDVIRLEKFLFISNGIASSESFSRKMGQLQINLIDSAAYRSTIRAIQRNRLEEKSRLWVLARGILMALLRLIIGRI